MSSSYSVVHFINENSVKAVSNSWIKAESLTKARDIADDARYRSHFTNTDEDDLLKFNIKNKNIMDSPTSSTSSMPIYDGKISI
ncbi:Uncharacterized protein FWK35_00018512 [Aphis craccivora]|uniref:Uncharacterized protein n=1 Tax=Aphis craccivora TaxID=307492 RepID=A0A6G0XAY4_APHCR|nr:Uncharacterized protein FWK35_00018512 [Aphis craccivora]